MQTPPCEPRKRPLDRIADWLEQDPSWLRRGALLFVLLGLAWFAASVAVRAI